MKGTWWQASALPWGGREGRRGPAQVAAHGRGQGVGGSPPGGLGDHRRHSIALDSARQQGRDLNKSWWSRGSAVAGAMPLSGATPHDVAGGRSGRRGGARRRGRRRCRASGDPAPPDRRAGRPSAGGCDHDGVVGIAEDRDEVRYQVEGHGQVGQQQPQPDPDAAGQRAVARQARMNAAGPEGAASPRRRRNAGPAGDTGPTDDTRTSPDTPRTGRHRQGGPRPGATLQPCRLDRTRRGAVPEPLITRRAACCARKAAGLDRVQ